MSIKRLYEVKNNERSNLFERVLKNSYGTIFCNLNSYVYALGALMCVNSCGCILNHVVHYETIFQAVPWFLEKWKIKFPKKVEKSRCDHFLASGRHHTHYTKPLIKETPNNVICNILELYEKIFARRNVALSDLIQGLTMGRCHWISTRQITILSTLSCVLLTKVTLPRKESVKVTFTLWE